MTFSRFAVLLAILALAAGPVFAGDVPTRPDWAQGDGWWRPEPDDPAVTPIQVGESSASGGAVWNIMLQGACCEGNMSARDDKTFVLLPILVNGNDILRSVDGGQSWEKVYPPADVSVPFGIEGHLQQYTDPVAGIDDVMYFGTEVADGVAALSEDGGDTWTTVQIPVAFVVNDQAWLYYAPDTTHALCPPSPLNKPYLLMGWYRIGTVALFSCDGGRTWPIQTPLPATGAGTSDNIVCESNLRAPAPPPVDPRIPKARFEKLQSIRHGNWGTDGNLYWVEADGADLIICKTTDLGTNWEGVVHPRPTSQTGIPVVHVVSDQNGTMYMLHADTLIVSRDYGETFHHVHTLPRWGNDFSVGDPGSAQSMVVDDGTVHIGLKSTSGVGTTELWYLRVDGADTASPAYTEEFVDALGTDRLDFMQIVVNGNGVPCMGYTGADGDVFTACRVTPSGCGSTTLFADGFNSGPPFNAWDQEVNRGGLSADTVTPIDGSQSLRVTLDPNSTGRVLDYYLVDDLTSPVDDYCFDFTWAPDNLDTPINGFAVIWGLRGDDGRRLVHLDARWSGTGHQLRMRVRLDDGSVAVTPWSNDVLPGPNVVGGRWTRSSGIGDGSAEFTVLTAAGPQTLQLQNLDNDLRAAQFAGIGYLGGRGRELSSGSMRFDVYESGTTP